MGNLPGLFISDEHIANDDAYLFVKQKLSRASRETMELLDDKDIYFVFPSMMSNTHTNLFISKLLATLQNLKNEFQSK